MEGVPLEYESSIITNWIIVDIAKSNSAQTIDQVFRGTPFKKNMFFYTFQLKKYDPKATYHLEAEIAGKDSNDSYGNITFNLSPTKAFSQVESSKN